MSFKIGAFDRTRAGVFHPFCPAHAVFSLTEVNLANLWTQGKRLILLDVDHTLVEWKQESFSQAVIDWIGEAKQRGFQLCIISNTRRVDRLGRLSKALGIETVTGKFKPSPSMYLKALEKFSCKPEEAIMIGDQIMTDILGANRSGIEAIWVQKMQGPEFVGTKINRFVERILTGVIYRALIAPMDEHPSQEEVVLKPPIWERAVFRQFIKFGVVGVSSFAIDWFIRSSIQERIKVDGQLVSHIGGVWLQAHLPWLFNFTSTPAKAFAPVSILIAATVATFNSFIWNRAWTFEAKDSQQRTNQLKRVYAVAYTGMAINLLITTVFYSIFHLKLFAATVIAAVVVAFWNFLGQRIYAFRAHEK